VCRVLNFSSFCLQFETPVVGSWIVDHGEMREVDLFTGSQWTTRDFDLNDDDIPASPSLYIGMHKKQVSNLMINLF